MNTPAATSTYNLAHAEDRARWDRVHSYQLGEPLSAVLWREFAEVERVWYLDLAVLEAYRRDLQRHTDPMDALERSIGNQLATGDNLTWLLHRQSAALVLERLATAFERAQMAPLIAAGRRWTSGQSKGGLKRAKQQRKDREHKESRILHAADAFLRTCESSGQDKRGVVAAMTEIYGMSESGMRRLLQRSGRIQHTSRTGAK